MNIFCVFTPFQKMVVDNIIEQYHKGEDNLVVSTISGNGKESKDTFSVGRKLSDVYKVWHLKALIKKNINNVCFFIPHLGSLFSSYFWHISQKHNRPINVYYEGLALFYDPIVKNPEARIKRKRIGWLFGINYKHYEQLYPSELVERVQYCYTPTIKLMDKYKSTRLFTFHKDKVVNSENILFLSSDVATINDIKECIRYISKCVSNIDQIIYFKQHYALNEDIATTYIQKFQESLKNRIIVLDKNRPIESLYGAVSFKYVVCHKFTSALINLQFMEGRDLRLFVVDERSVPKDIIDSLGIKIYGIDAA